MSINGPMPEGLTLRDYFAAATLASAQLSQPWPSNTAELAYEIADKMIAERAKCDGNHASPECDDPQCWNNKPVSVTIETSPVKMMWEAMRSEVLHELRKWIEIAERNERSNGINFVKLGRGTLEHWADKLERAKSCDDQVWPQAGPVVPGSTIDASNHASPPKSLDDRLREAAQTITGIASPYYDVAIINFQNGPKNPNKPSLMLSGDGGRCGQMIHFDPVSLQPSIEPPKVNHSMPADYVAALERAGLNPDNYRAEYAANWESPANPLADVERVRAKILGERREAHDALRAIERDSVRRKGFASPMQPAIKMGMAPLDSWPTMRVCPSCGNKRCPHAQDSRFECTRSNEPKQIPYVSINGAEFYYEDNSPPGYDYEANFGESIVFEGVRLLPKIMGMGLSCDACSLLGQKCPACVERIGSPRKPQACENCLYTGKPCPECLPEWERANREV